MRWAIAGKGRSGQAAYEFLRQQGAAVVFLDDAEQTLNPEQIVQFDAVLLSPGIPRRHPAILAALKAKIPIYNEIDVAIEQLPGCICVGITGSNGKSTTTALLGHIMQKYEANTFVGGNLGRPLCQALLEGQSPRYAILELSSFQLETLSKLQLRVAILLNLSPNHLDRYDSVEDYYAAKKRIVDLLEPQGVLIRPTGDSILFKPPKTLIGVHNLQNIKAAVKAAQALGIPDKLIQEGLDEFPGIPHRLEILGEIKGVRWINDSKATTVESVLAALACFDQGVHLILGGRGKGDDYTRLKPALQKAVKAVYTIGEESPRIVKALSPITISIQEVQNLQNAVNKAFQAARPGDIVLLSPACASYDQFRDFEHRGEEMRKLFHALCKGLKTI